MRSVKLLFFFKLLKLKKIFFVYFYIFIRFVFLNLSKKINKILCKYIIRKNYLIKTISATIDVKLNV